MEVADFSSERLLELGKFGFCTYKKTLAIEYDGELGLPHLAQTDYR